MISTDTKRIGINQLNEKIRACERCRLAASRIVSNGQAIFPLPHPSFLLYRPSHEPETAEMHKKRATVSG